MVPFNITPGIKGEKALTVSRKDTASAYGSGHVDVFATPAMVALMEMTARDSLQTLLPEGFTTVGTEVSVKHLRASAIGHTVRCESKVVEVSGKKVVFEVQVWDDAILVGHGNHTRAIVELKKFMENYGGGQR